MLSFAPGAGARLRPAMVFLPSARLFVLLALAGAASTAQGNPAPEAPAAPAPSAAPRGTEVAPDSPRAALSDFVALTRKGR